MHVRASRYGKENGTMDPEDISAEGNETGEAQVEPTSVGGESSEQPEAPRGNPAWDGIRSELGDVNFSRIESHLKNFDSNHDRAISKLNEKYSWARELEEQGVGPDHVKAAVQLARAMDESPEQVYDRLGQFLREQGRMPDSAKELEAKTDDPDEEEFDDDPRLKQLQQQQEQMQQFLLQQEQERIQKESDEQLEAEIDALKNDESLNLSKDDMREVLQRAVYFTQTGKNLPLAEVAKDYVENVRNRILATPRPGASAPRLVPTSGGNAAVGQQKNPGDMSREETQSLIASLIAGDSPRS
jgi:hypothetical protein